MSSAPGKVSYECPLGFASEYNIHIHCGHRTITHKQTKTYKKKKQCSDKFNKSVIAIINCTKKNTFTDFAQKYLHNWSTPSYNGAFKSNIICTSFMAQCYPARWLLTIVRYSEESETKNDGFGIGTFEPFERRVIFIKAYMMAFCSRFSVFFNQFTNFIRQWNVKSFYR